MTSPILRTAWPPHRVEQFQLAQAQRATDAGITFRAAATPAERTEVQNLVRAEVAGSADMEVGENDGVVVALAPDQRVVAGLVVTGIKFPTRTLMHLRDVAVMPSWRGHGIGALLVLMREQLYRVDSTVGGCSPELAGFYQRCGMTVLHPGEPFPIGVLAGAGDQLALNPNLHHPCWFFSDRTAALTNSPASKPGISRRTAAAKRKRRR